MRFRVHFEDREPKDVEANELEFTSAGGVVLRQQDFESRHVQDRSGALVQARVPVRSELRGAWSRDARWTEVEQLEEEEGGAAAPPLEEVYAR